MRDLSATVQCGVIRSISRSRKRKNAGIGDAVHVVERDDAVRRLAAVERVQDLGGDGALLVGRLRDAREQRLGRGAPRRVVRFERDEQAFDQALEVVAGVDGYPGNRRFGRQAGDLLREQHRLAVAGGRADQHDPAGQERVGELRVQLAALDVGRAGAGRLELGAGEGHAAMLLAEPPALGRCGGRADGRWRRTDRGLQAGAAGRPLDPAPRRIYFGYP